jgi:hypothetical protein
MTREEARKIVFDKCRNLEGRECQGFVDALEALGLIKFEGKSKTLIEELKVVIECTTSDREQRTDEFHRGWFACSDMITAIINKHSNENKT